MVTGALGYGGHFKSGAVRTGICTVFRDAVIPVNWNRSIVKEADVVYYTKSAYEAQVNC